ncbi:MAG: hypothetical protein KJP05_06900, partial [Deltaproteobacteria bacterium]|nr:hypothetical protein [Deltaproteobacteria bacterium]
STCSDVIVTGKNIFGLRTFLDIKLILGVKNQDVSGTVSESASSHLFSGQDSNLVVFLVYDGDKFVSTAHIGPLRNLKRISSLTRKREYK